MPALNFQQQWAAAVEYGAILARGQGVVSDGTLTPKRTTIRRPGRVHPGNTLYLYTGQRTKACHKLGEAMCLSVTRVRVMLDRDYPMIRLADQWLMHAQCERLARLDTAGLWSVDRFVAFFADQYGLPFDGELIGW